jgi:hypothetical protein
MEVGNPIWNTSHVGNFFQISTDVKLKSLLQIHQSSILDKYCSMVISKDCNMIWVTSIH